MYFDRYGSAFPQSTVAAFAAARSALDFDAPLTLNGVFVDGVRFDPWRLLDADTIAECRLSAGREQGRQLTARDFAAAFDAQPDVLRLGDPVTYFVRLTAPACRFRELYRLLAGIAGGSSLSQVIAAEGARPGTDPHDLEIAASLLAVLGLARVRAGEPERAASRR